MRAIHHAVLATLLMIAVSAGGALAQDSDGFSTPEEAIVEYLAGVADQDVQRILGAVAIDEVSEGYQIAGVIDRLGAFFPVTMPAPAEYPFYADINRAFNTNGILRQALMLSYSLLSDVELGGEPITGVDAQWGAGFVDDVDPSRLSSLKVVDIRPANASIMSSDRYIEIVARQAALQGADELTERVVLIEFEGDLYGLGFTLARYGDSWKVYSQHSALAGFQSSGAAVPTTVERFERFTAGE